MYSKMLFSVFLHTSYTQEKKRKTGNTGMADPAQQEGSFKDERL
jgi:hypothetical protein